MSITIKRRTNRTYVAFPLLLVCTPLMLVICIIWWPLWILAVIISLVYQVIKQAITRT